MRINFPQAGGSVFLRKQTVDFNVGLSSRNISCHFLFRWHKYLLIPQLLAVPCVFEGRGLFRPPNGKVVFIPAGSSKEGHVSIAKEIQVHLPHLRRYARALLGTQAAGDAFVRACLEVILEDTSMFRHPNEMRITLYHLFQTILSSTVMQIGDRSVVNGTGTGDVLPLLYRSAEMSLDSRQALLLTTLEGFTYEEAARIMNREENEVEELVNAALAEIDERSALRVLIIEDEPIISMDLENLIEELGHTVVGVASTHTEAVELATTGHPELILADIQLADGSSGLEAVTDILKQFNVPVVFLTAFPERLLTGERPEPAFLITKPFDRRVVKATIGQAIDVS